MRVRVKVEVRVRVRVRVRARVADAGNLTSKKPPVYVWAR